MTSKQYLELQLKYDFTPLEVILTMLKSSKFDKIALIVIVEKYLKSYKDSMVLIKRIVDEEGA